MEYGFASPEGKASRDIDHAVAYVKELFCDNSGGHDAEHTLRVFRTAMVIAETEPDCDRGIVALAALLHDVDDHKLFHTTNNANARAFLAERQIESGQIEKICSAVNSVSFSRNRNKKPETLEGQIVQDADRLDAIGAIGIARTFAFGGEHGRTLEETIRHFYEKLLLLREGLNTKAAREMAAPRHAFMESFLKEFSEEVGETGKVNTP